MPIILTTTEAARLIGAKCGGSAPDTEDPELLALLVALTPRVEAAMNVDSLAYGERINRFYLNSRPTSVARGPVKTTLRLSAGFIDTDLLVWKDEDGTILTPPAAIAVDKDMGTVDIYDWSRGYYTLEYYAGFYDNCPTAPNETPVFQDVPEWLKSIAAVLLVQWYRTVFLQPRANKNVSFSAQMNALYRQVQTLIYAQYQRPRANLVWAENRS